MLDVLRLILDTCNFRGLSSVSPNSSIFKLTHVFFFQQDSLIGILYGGKCCMQLIK